MSSSTDDGSWLTASSPTSDPENCSDPVGTPRRRRSIDQNQRCGAIGRLHMPDFIGHLPLSKAADVPRNEQDADQAGQAPDHTANCGPTRAATAPDSPSPNRLPAMRRQKTCRKVGLGGDQGVRRCRIKTRNTVPKTSDAPVMPNSRSPIHRMSTNPNTTIARPHPSMQKTRAWLGA